MQQRVARIMQMHGLSDRLGFLAGGDLGTCLGMLEAAERVEEGEDDPSHQEH